MRLKNGLETSSGNNCTDVDEVHLSADICVRRINDDATAVGTETRMSIAAPFAFILRRRVEPAERHFFACRCVAQINVLFSLFVRIGVVENPDIAGQVTAMSVLSHNILADYLDFICAVLIEIKGVFV